MLRNFVFNLLLQSKNYKLKTTWLIILTLALITSFVFSLYIIDSVFNAQEIFISLLYPENGNVILEGIHATVPGRKCPTCLEGGQTVWVIPGKCCPQCGTPVNMVSPFLSVSYVGSISYLDALFNSIV